jgi:hypothetical protein
MRSLAAGLGFACSLVAQALQLPPKYPQAQYDEAKVPSYTLPDPLVMLNGKRVRNAKIWMNARRPEILRLFETDVYGRTMAGRPKEMTWEVTAEDRRALDGKAITKTVRLYFAGKKEGAGMDLYLTLPNTGKPAAVFLVAGGRVNQLALGRGYGVVVARIDQVQADNVNGYAKSIRKYFAPADQLEPGEDEWGAVGAWAWALSRAMDYLETDKDVDAKRVALNGVSRFGKVAMWAGAQDQRFGITFSGESGCGGAVIVRRQYGETVRSITGFAPYWFDANFRKYADRVDDLPVDWHELIALHAPRPVYIATAERDYWGDPRGSFLAAKAAEPVYRLFGESGLGVDDMPAVETPVGGFIGFHCRKGSHGQNDYDWEQFLNFADRHFGRQTK